MNNGLGRVSRSLGGGTMRKALTCVVSYSSLHMLIFKVKSIAEEEIRQSISAVQGALKRYTEINEQNTNLTVALEQIDNSLTAQQSSSKTDALLQAVVSLCKYGASKGVVTGDVIEDSIVTLSTCVKALAASRVIDASCSQEHVYKLAALSAVANLCVAIAQEINAENNSSNMLGKNAVRIAALAGMLPCTTNPNQYDAVVKDALREEVEAAKKLIISEEVASKAKLSKVAPLTCGFAIDKLYDICHEEFVTAKDVNFVGYYLLQTLCIVKGLQELLDVKEPSPKSGLKRVESILKGLLELESSYFRAYNDRKQISPTKILGNNVAKIRKKFIELEKEEIQSAFSHLAGYAEWAWYRLEIQIFLQLDAACTTSPTIPSSNGMTPTIFPILTAEEHGHTTWRNAFTTMRKTRRNRTSTAEISWKVDNTPVTSDKGVTSGNVVNASVSSTSVCGDTSTAVRRRSDAVDTGFCEQNQRKGSCELQSEPQLPHNLTIAQPTAINETADGSTDAPVTVLKSPTCQKSFKSEIVVRISA